MNCYSTEVKSIGYGDDLVPRNGMLATRPLDVGDKVLVLLPKCQSTIYDDEPVSRWWYVV